MEEFTKEENNKIYDSLKNKTFPGKVLKYILGKYYLTLLPGFLNYNKKEQLEHMAPQGKKGKEIELPEE